jgi:membrane associated rhomboid family serine protease
MTPTSVGMRCPECSRDRTKVRRMPTVPSAPVVTQALIAINVVAFLIETATGAPLGGGGVGTVWNHGFLFGPAITGSDPTGLGTHEYWRLLTAGFLHDGLLHIFINMISLWFVGSVLEPAIGRVNFLAVYFVSLLAGSFGALWFQPQIPTVGASGAIFGIFGALIVVARARGIPIWQSGLGFVLVFNLLFSLSVRGISVGDHIGGLVGGLITGWLIVEVAERRRMAWAALAGCAVIAVASVVGSLVVAGGHGLTPNGIGFSL